MPLFSGRQKVQTIDRVIFGIRYRQRQLKIGNLNKIIAEPEIVAIGRDKDHRRISLIFLQCQIQVTLIVKRQAFNAIIWEVTNLSCCRELYWPHRDDLGKA